MMSRDRRHEKVDPAEQETAHARRDSSGILPVARLFIAYSRDDRGHIEALVKHLAPLTREGLLQVWHDGDIKPGEDWNQAITASLSAADIIVILVSASFISSYQCYDVELTKAMKRHEEKSAVLIPVVVGKCLWENLPFGRLQALPTDAKPVQSWPDEDDAWTNVASGIREIALRLRALPMKSVFISYSHHDHEFCQALITHLAILQHRGLISTWHDRELAPGSAWQSVIDDRLEDADIILILVSADFLASRFCQDVELGAALRRWKAREVTIIPVIVRDCDWQASALAAFQALPSGARPVRQWPDRDEAWAQVTRQIRAVVESSSHPAPPPRAAAPATSAPTGSSPESAGRSIPESIATAEPPDGRDAPRHESGAAGRRDTPPATSAGTGRRIDRARFLAACTPAAAALFTFLLDEAIRRGHHIYWGTSGFSVGAHYPGPRDRWSFAYGFPPDDFQFYFQDGAPWSGEDEAAPFRRELLLTGLFREGGRLTLKAHVDDTTSARAHEAARKILAHVEATIHHARSRPE